MYTRSRKYDIIANIKFVVARTVFFRDTVSVMIEESSAAALTSSHTGSWTERFVLYVVTRVLTVRVALIIRTSAHTIERTAAGGSRIHPPRNVDVLESAVPSEGGGVITDGLVWPVLPCTVVVEAARVVVSVVYYAPTRLEEVQPQ